MFVFDKVVVITLNLCDGINLKVQTRLYHQSYTRKTIYGHKDSDKMEEKMDLHFFKRYRLRGDSFLHVCRLGRPSLFACLCGFARACFAFRMTWILSRAFVTSEKILWLCKSCVQHCTFNIKNLESYQRGLFEQILPKPHWFSRCSTGSTYENLEFHSASNVCTEAQSRVRVIRKARAMQQSSAKNFSPATSDLGC